VSPLGEKILVYLLVMITMVATLGYFSLTLKKIEDCFKRCKGMFRLHITGILLILLSLALWRIRTISVSAYVFHLLVIAGASFYMYPAIKSKRLRLDKELLSQILGVFLAILVFFPRIPIELRGVAVFVAVFQSLVLIVMKWLQSMNLLTTFEKKCLCIASWLVVVFSWLRLYQLTRNSNCLYYGAFVVMFISSVLFLYPAMVAYERVSRWL
jgi:hypothetical protein